MNGRNITSWGIDPRIQSSGSVKRALYEPSDRWHYEMNGQITKREGIEARYFYFLPTSESTSIAEDGGLIEVQIFRAQGRRRRAPILATCRSQELYGIV